MGSAFTLADCAAAPALFYARHVMPFTGRWTYVEQYDARLLERPSFARVVDEAKPYLASFSWRLSIFSKALPSLNPIQADIGKRYHQRQGVERRGIESKSTIEFGGLFRKSMDDHASNPDGVRSTKDS